MSILNRGKKEETSRCAVTSKPFALSPKEIDCYASFELPNPIVCPVERYRRLLSFKNERQFFWRECSKTKKRIYSSFAPNAPFPVVCLDYWFEKSLSETESGIEYDFSLSLFDQFRLLWVATPRPASNLRNILTSLAGENTFGQNKSFFVFDSTRVLECFYSFSRRDCRQCIDCYLLDYCEQCYECIDCHQSSMLRWAEHCVGCKDSWFIVNCENCENCLFCSNLQGRKFCIFNNQVSESEYFETVEQWAFGVRSRVDEAKTIFQTFLKDQPIPHIYADKSESCSGNYLRNCDDVDSSFECADSQQLMHCHSLNKAKNCLEGVSFGEELYDSAQFVGVGLNAKHIRNSVECWNNVSYLDYCMYCEDSQHLLGCIGLQSKEYCILNQQYSKEEYFSLYAQIKSSLADRNLWGKPFPVGFSDFAYNHSSAFDYMPLTKVQAQVMGYRWDEQYDGIKPSQLLASYDDSEDDFYTDSPQNIRSFRDSRIGSAVFLCEISGQPFQYCVEEVSLYKKMEVAPPARAFEQRHLERIAKLGPKSLLHRKMRNSSKEVFTAFPFDWHQDVVERRAWEKIKSKN